MRILLIALFVPLFLPVNLEARQNQINFPETIDLYNGIDKNFYYGSNFGAVNPIYSAYPVSAMIRYNRVDGIFLGYQEEKMDWESTNLFGLEDIDVHGLLGYSVAQDEIQYSIGAEKSIGVNRKWLLIGGDIHSSTATEDYWRSGIYENSVASLTTGFDFHDYHKADGFGLYSLIKPLRTIELGLSYNVDEFSSLKANTDFSIFPRYSTFRINPAIDDEVHQINQQSLNLGLTINPGSLAKHALFWTTLSAKIELADLEGSSNTFLYNKYQAEAKSFLRLDKSTVLKWRILSGTITGEAPDFKNFALGGIGSLRAVGYKSMTGNQVLLSNFEIELGKSSGKEHGWVDLSSFFVSLFLDSGTSRVNQSLFNTTNPVNDVRFSLSEFSHNAGVGMGLGMLRLEVAKPVSGVDGQTAFWVRFNPTF